jgi:hypothetical protein
MVTVRGSAALLSAATLLAACAQIEGLGGIERVSCLDDCPQDAGATESAAPAHVDAGVPAPPPPPPPAVDGGTESGIDGGVDAGGTDAPPPPVDGNTPPSWLYHREVALTSDAPAALSNEPVLVVLPAMFDASHAKPGGDDLRFSTSATHADDLSYYVESWSPGATSYVWVSVPSVPVGESTIHMFYGNASSAAASSFAATFPHAMRTAGGGSGSFIATGDIAVDWFELRAGDTLILPQGVPLNISARRVILSGIIGGNGRGFAGGTTPDGQGGGGCGGGPSHPVDTESSGGGGNGGIGGHGGEHVAGNGGPGGAAAGTATGADVAPGCGGGAANANAGGAGGGAVSVLGWRTTALDLVRADGLQNVGGSDRNGGGGAGGGILVAGYLLDLSGVTLSAVGGTGGDCAQSSGSGGGGGSGGRIKLKVHPGGALTPPASMTVTGGAGGTCSGTAAAGAAGSAGTTSTDMASAIVTGVEASLGVEQAL